MKCGVTDAKQTALEAAHKIVELAAEHVGAGIPDSTEEQGGRYAANCISSSLTNNPLRQRTPTVRRQGTVENQEYIHSVCCLTWPMRLLEVKRSQWTGSCLPPSAVKSPSPPQKLRPGATFNDPSRTFYTYYRRYVALCQTFTMGGK